MKCCRVTSKNGQKVTYTDSVIWYDAQFLRIRYMVDGVEECVGISTPSVAHFEEWYQDVEGKRINPPEQDNGI